jgi:hypothetical protein
LGQRIGGEALCAFRFYRRKWERTTGDVAESTG